MNSSIPVYTISLPEYKIEAETDWLAVGRRLDDLVMTHFQGKRLAIRGIGLVDHPGRSLQELVSTILELGTDKYDPDRKGLHYKRDEASDICAGPCLVTKDGLKSPRDLDGSVMAFCVQIFYEGALADRGYSIRLDVLMLYDLDQLQPLGDLAPEECFEFAFKHPDRKREALLGVIKILRE